MKKKGPYFHIIVPIDLYNIRTSYSLVGLVKVKVEQVMNVYFEQTHSMDFGTISGGIIFATICRGSAS